MRPADRVLVVARDSDLETQEVLRHCLFHLPMTLLVVDVPGQVAALNAGLTSADGDVLSITDDDAVPRADWLQRIEHHFVSDPTLAGVGGRDYLQDGHAYSDTQVVGKIQWFGRHIGNHHRGVGPARYVDVLKGANMSYRLSAIGSLRFDSRLLGAGAQMHNDMSFSLRLKRRGWRLLYDPAVAVDHYSAERHDEDGRVYRSPAAILNEAHNETVAILEYLPARRWSVFLTWAILVGHRSLPGALQCLRLSAMGDRAWPKLRPVIAGRCLGVRTVLRTSAPSED
jgi:GT2 family glycosyltransferase